jgi:hypothetical protein
MAQVLREAFRSLSMLYYPYNSTLPLAVARDQFRQLQEAYLVLGDPQRRSAYDSQLRLALLQRVQALSPPIATSAPGPGPMMPGPVSTHRPLSVRRAFSGGEWFALVLLAMALLFSLVLGLGLAWWRGVELVTQPPLTAPASAQPADPIERSVERHTEGSTAGLPGDELLTAPSDAPLQPPAAGVGAVAE